MSARGESPQGRMRMREEAEGTGSCNNNNNNDYAPFLKTTNGSVALAACTGNSLTHMQSPITLGQIAAMAAAGHSET
eukprot:scaffold172801_cov32-Tisochrysis_lutea.AAC.1